MSDKYEPPSGTRGDAAHAVVRAALNAIPVAGGGAVELFNWLMTPPIERRRQAWMNDVADGLRALEDAGAIKLEELRESDAFVDVVLHATQAAIRTSQEEKRTALRNAVLNATAAGAPDVAEQQVFVGMIDDLTEWHLRLLKLFQNPRAHVGNLSMGGLSSIPEDAYSELRGRRDFYDQVWRELYGRGLVNTEGLHTTMSSHGLASKRTTDRGDRFLSLIATPAPLDGV